MCIDTNTWRMIHGNKANKSSEVVPPGRHSHTSVVFDQAMWVYGGMTDLTERSDLWKLDLGIFFCVCKKYVNSNLNHFLHIKKVTLQWSSVKCKPAGPGPLHGHSAVRVRSHMLVIGGEKQGNLSDEVWRFHFRNLI